jgi:hypothetical protein
VKLKSPVEIKKMIDECTVYGKNLPTDLSLYMFPHIMMMVRFADWVLGGKESPLDQLQKVHNEYIKERERESQ